MIQPAPRPRTLIHPGAFNPVRIRSLRAVRARHFRLLLPTGQTLMEALVGPLVEAGVSSASMTLLGGSFSVFRYCVAPPDPTRNTVIAYSAPIDLGAVGLVFGNATMGKNLHAQPLIHCHAAFSIGSEDVRGGHLITDACVVGHDPIPVLVTTLDGFDLQQSYDPETNMQLLQPYEVNSHA